LDRRVGAREPHARTHRTCVGAAARTQSRRPRRRRCALPARARAPAAADAVVRGGDAGARARAGAAPDQGALPGAGAAPGTGLGHAGRLRGGLVPVPARERQTFPLVPRRRLVGLPFGDLPSRRRGHGSDVIGTRPYEIGDPVSTIDWFASARLSAATGRDEFIVRDHASDEAPRVALVCDRRPAMGIYDASLPWLSKPRALVEITAAIVASAVAARADVASLDYAGAEPYWLPPGRRDTPWLVAERQAEETPFDAPEDNVEQAL